LNRACLLSLREKGTGSSTRACMRCQAPNADGQAQLLRSPPLPYKGETRHQSRPAAAPRPLLSPSDAVLGLGSELQPSPSLLPSAAAIHGAAATMRRSHGFQGARGRGLALRRSFGCEEHRRRLSSLAGSYKSHRRPPLWNKPYSSLHCSSCLAPAHARPAQPSSRATKATIRGRSELHYLSSKFSPTRPPPSIFFHIQHPHDPLLPFPTSIGRPMPSLGRPPTRFGLSRGRRRRDPIAFSKVTQGPVCKGILRFSP